MKNISRFLLIIIAAATLMTSLTFAAPALVGADAATDAACAGVGAVTGSKGCQTPAGTTSPDSLLSTIINILSIVLGAIAVIMIIIAGIRFVTSAGDSNNVNSARNTILYAIVGLVIAAMAQVIVHFVLNRIGT